MGGRPQVTFIKKSPRRPVVEVGGKLYCTKHGEELRWTLATAYLCVSCEIIKRTKQQ